MGKEQSYQKAAKEILRLIGGKENIISAAHCATRLRLVLKDEKLADVEGILNTELVKGQFATGGQFQIIIGSGTVDEVYKYFIQYADIKESSKNEVKQAADKKMNPLQQLVKMLADVFVPIIPALVASGLLMGLNNILTAEGLFANSCRFFSNKNVWWKSISRSCYGNDYGFGRPFECLFLWFCDHREYGSSMADRRIDN